MKLVFSAPSKTFLTGEYAVLAGGPALIAATEPRFGWTAKKGGTGRVTGIPENSPAARWLKAREPVWQDWDIEFFDPHEKRGGFGASGAQFLFAHAFTTFLQSSVGRAAQGLDIAAILNDYRVLAEGSGADVLAMAAGRIALISTEPLATDSKPWPFADLAFQIFRTNTKVATHEHLRELDLSELKSLRTPAIECAEAFLGSSKDFMKSFKSYSQLLADMGLQAPGSLEHVQAFQKESWCVGAKGCGAMGADTLVVLCAPADRAAVQSLASERGLTWAADESTLTSGLEMKWSWDAD